MSNTAGLSVTSGDRSAATGQLAARTLHALLALACVAALLAAAFAVAYAFSPKSAPVTVVPATQSSSAALPQPWPAADALEPVTLPRRLCRPTAATCFDHFEVSLPQPAPEAVFLPGFAGSVIARLNGETVAAHGTFKPPIARLLFRPVYFELPKHLLREADNRLVISVGTDRGVFHNLDPFYLGDAASLKPAWRYAHWLSHSVLVWSCGAYLVLALISLLTVAMAGRAPLFGWLALIALSATARNVFFLWTDPTHDNFRLCLYYAASLTLPLACLAFAARLVEHRAARWLAWAPLLVIPALAWMGWEVSRDAYTGLYRADTFTRLASVVVGLPTIYLIVRYVVREWHPLKPWIAALFAGAFLLTLHDVQAGLRGSIITVQLSNLAPLLLVLAFCLMLAQQYGGALLQVRQHNRQLRAAVLERERELAALHETASAAVRREAVSNERERILRDMHDGVGGRLAGLIMMARRRGQDDMERHLEESLSDLRWIIDSIDDTAAQSLAEMFDHLRERIDPWLTANGVASDWAIDATLPELPVRPRWRLQLYRLMQEALNNVVRHARAGRVCIEASVRNGALHITVRDDGRGFGASATPGRGLSHLRERAAALGGNCDIESTPGNGTTVHVSAPFAGVLAPQDSGGDAPSPVGVP